MYCLIVMCIPYIFCCVMQVTSAVWTCAHVQPSTSQVVGASQAPIVQRGPQPLSTVTAATTVKPTSCSLPQVRSMFNQLPEVLKCEVI